MARPTLAQACTIYIHRFTAEHVPAWATKPCEGKFYAPQFASDAEWYANTKFYGEPGHIGVRHECHTTGQTWPFGKWLAQPYRVGVTPVAAEQLEAYLQHGDGAGPFHTESVPVKRNVLWWQERGLSYTATGYGSRIPTEYMVQVNGKWRRVYCRIYSNSGTLFIGRGDSKITVQIDRV